MGTDVYTFGASDTAGQRLALLAEVYQPSARELLRRWAPPEVGHAVDLGCGPGHTTRMLHRLTGATRTTGVERSPEYVAAFRAAAPEGVTVVEHDVTDHPLPVEAADVVYARFLLTHLADPAAAVRGWAGLLRPGGRLLLQETSGLVSREPCLGRYYELVAELQHHHGQELDIGARLGGLAAGTGLVVEHEGTREVLARPAEMAALHVLNLRTWRHTDYARGGFDEDELDALDEALVAVARGGPSEPVEAELGELVLTRA